MKNTNLQYRKPAITARVMFIILLLTSAVSFSACGNKGLEVGLFAYGEFTPEFMCGYQSDSNVFNINDVTFDFYYGHRNSNDAVPTFELYFLDENENMHLIKKANEELTSQKYNIQSKYVPFLMRFFINNLTYNHSEKITVPKELFTKAEGYLFFVLSTESMYWEDVSDCRLCDHKYKTHILARQIMYYKIDGDRVIIYNDQYYD